MQVAPKKKAPKKKAPKKKAPKKKVGENPLPRLDFEHRQCTWSSLTLPFHLCRSLLRDAVDSEEVGTSFYSGSGALQSPHLLGSL